MHRFTELADRAAIFALHSLNAVYDETVDALQTSGATVYVKNLQMVTLSKAIFAVGMFSIFEAMLQDDLQAKNGFAQAKAIMKSLGEHAVEENFSNYCLAINVLKHGEGASYAKLLTKKATLPFLVLDESDLSERQYDLSSVNTLIEVDDRFIENCGKIINEVTALVQRVRPGTLL